MTSFSIILAHRDAGRYGAAAQALRDRLAEHPADAAAHAHLAHVLLLAGQDAAAGEALQAALALDGALPVVRRNHARLLLKTQRAQEALAQAEALRRDDPADPENALVLSGVLAATGQAARAAALVEEVLAAAPGLAEAHVARGQIRLRSGDAKGALADLEAALAFKPGLTPLWGSAALLRRRTGDLPGAIAAFETALRHDPDNPRHLTNLGEFKRQAGQTAAAIELLQRAATLAPGMAETWLNLGAALQADKRSDEARSAYERALAIDPGLSEAHFNIGRMLKDDERLAEAEASYRQAIAIRPDFAEAHYALGNLLRELGRLDEARACFRRGVELRPQLHYALHAFLTLPAVADSAAAVAENRGLFENGLQGLAAMPGPFDIPDHAIAAPTFYLAYQGLDDRALMEALSATLAAKAPDLAGAAARSTAARVDGRIKVGFLSEFFSRHTIGKLYQGLIQRLDRSRFEVVVIHGPNSKADAFRAALDASADAAVAIPQGFRRQRQVLAGLGLDVLFFPDIGMSLASYFLASVRHAPVQAVSWGHPATTGLATLDYFLSAGSIEPPDADRHYTERLVRLRRLPAFYEPPALQARDRATLGLPPEGTLYGCPQSLFKLHPEFDAVLAAIAQGDPAGHIILLDGKPEALRATLEARWARSHPILLDRTRFLPKVSADVFVSLIAQMDVLLDPLHFGSGNTLYEAMVAGTPIVTCPGAFARSRIVAGAYSQMGVADAPVVSHVEDYAPMALALARDPGRCAALREASAAAAERELFCDRGAVQDLEAFLTAAVKAAGRGERLPVGWRPEMETEHAA